MEFPGIYYPEVYASKHGGDRIMLLVCVPKYDMDFSVSTPQSSFSEAITSGALPSVYKATDPQSWWLDLSGSTPFLIRVPLQMKGKNVQPPCVAMVRLRPLFEAEENRLTGPHGVKPLNFKWAQAKKAIHLWLRAWPGMIVISGVVFVEL